MQASWSVERYARCYARNEEQYADALGMPMYTLLPAIHTHCRETSGTRAVAGPASWCAISADPTRSISVTLTVPSAHCARMQVACVSSETTVLENLAFPRILVEGALKTCPRKTSLGFRYTANGRPRLFQLIFSDPFACQLLYEQMQRFGLICAAWISLDTPLIRLAHSSVTEPKDAEAAERDQFLQKLTHSTLETHVSSQDTRIMSTGPTLPSQSAIMSPFKIHANTHHSPVYKTSCPSGAIAPEMPSSCPILACESPDTTNVPGESLSNSFHNSASPNCIQPNNQETYPLSCSMDSMQICIASPDDPSAPLAAKRSAKTCRKKNVQQQLSRETSEEPCGAFSLEDIVVDQSTSQLSALMDDDEDWSFIIPESQMIA